jgi:hypothetical protein
VPHLHEIANHRIRLLGIAGPIVEDVAVRRITPQQVGAGERPEKQRVALQSIGVIGATIEPTLNLA